MGARGDLYCGRCGRQVSPSERCPGRCPMPDGNGSLCRETGDLLPAGSCRADCGHRQTAERWRGAT